MTEKQSQKDIQKKCLEELKKYYEIKKDIGKNWLSSSSNIYLIDRKWLKSWKKYINKSYLDEKYELKKNKNSSKKKEDIDWVESKPPGQISNSELLLNLESFYNDNDGKNPENYIIKQDLSMKRDYKLIHEDLWNFFHKKYGGGPKLCYTQNTSKQNEKNQKQGFQFNKTELKLIFLPDKKEIIGNDEKIKTYFNIKNIKSIFIEKEKKISDLIEKIAKTENNILNEHKKNFYGEKIKEKEINIWFCNLNDFSVNKFDVLMIDYYGKDALHKALKNNITIQMKQKIP